MIARKGAPKKVHIDSETKFGFAPPTFGREGRLLFLTRQVTRQVRPVDPDVARHSDRGKTFVSFAFVQVPLKFPCSVQC